MRKILFHTFIICFTAQFIFADDWFEPKSASDLAGFWESNLVIPIAKDTIPGFPESSISLGLIINNTAPSGKDQKVKLSIKFDLNKFMDDIVSLPEMKIYSFTKDMLWELMSQSFTEGMEEVDITIGKYFFTINQTYNTDKFFFDDTNQVLVNSGRTKMLLVSDMDISQGLSDAGVFEVIFTKR